MKFLVEMNRILTQRRRTQNIEIFSCWHFKLYTKLLARSSLSFDCNCDRYDETRLKRKEK